MTVRKSIPPPSNTDHPNWGFSYMGAALQAGLPPINAFYRKFKERKSEPGVISHDSHSYMALVREQALQLKDTYNKLFSLLQYDMPMAMGAAGKPADTHAILETCRDMMECCQQLADWEEYNHQHYPTSARLTDLRKKLMGFTAPGIAEMSRLANHLASSFGGDDAPDEVTFKMEFNPNASIAEVEQLLEAYAQNPDPIPAHKRKHFNRPPKRRSLLSMLGLFWLFDWFRSE